MRLSRIKLAGFKSFVDPTTLRLGSNLVGVVGPNGSGKSNIIDAVRWVMGESSAKHLRGEAMADVVFNGSASRKPVSQASVELVFDNADGRLGGPYARYAEISVKRVVNRDGQSQYFLNGTRCRRRDITDLFLGTGLGPRSYAIIEQGMITRLIEARPEELRAVIEEAAGISKYKERRRETETRMRHTHENLSRLKDIQEEVEKQLEKLARQARTAERFQTLRAEQRRLKGERLALDWRALSERLERLRQAEEEAHTALEAARARQRALEKAVETLRADREDAETRFNAVQARYYESGAQLATLEQALRHARERLAALEKERRRLEASRDSARAASEGDEAELHRLEKELDGLAPRVEVLREREAEAREALDEAEADLAQWRQRWDAHLQGADEPRRRAEVTRTRIEHLERRLEELAQRAQAVERALEEDDIPAWEAEREALEAELAECRRLEQEASARLEGLDADLAGRQAALEETRAHLDALRKDRQRLHGRREALQALQEQALEAFDGAGDWLRDRGLHGAPPLSERLQVDVGWERAVEVVLGRLLQGRLVDDPEAHLDALAAADGFDLALLADAPWARGEAGLAAHVTAPAPLLPRLERIHTAPDVETARAVCARLAPGESVITPDGLWLGPGWVSLQRRADPLQGTLARARELKALAEEETILEARLEDTEARVRALAEEVTALTGERREVERDLQAQRRRHASLEGRLEGLDLRIRQQRERHAQLREEAESLAERRIETREALAAARCELESALEAMEAARAQGEALREEGEALQNRVEEGRLALRDLERDLREAEIREQRLRTQIQARREQLERARARLEEINERLETVTEEVRAAAAPIAGQEAELARALAARAELEKDLNEARAAVEGRDHDLRERERERLEAEQAVQRAQEHLDAQRLAVQEARVRRQALEERFNADGLDLRACLDQLPADADAADWDRRLEELARAIERLGPINLAAIDEHRELSQRKAYLDSQRADLEEALATLENAIRRIDRETRSRFKETFERIDKGLKGLFPRLFGGGQAHLELTGEDLLDTGVAIMARPPGKRITNIHLLSGGEKALTAVALVFAIFQLNPAPFCMLDEVDAPLDEANVGRFCRLLKEMSQQVQFIFITHNKATMEVAEQLNGVTMHEPGVSRLVTVDVAEAVALAEV